MFGIERMVLYIGVLLIIYYPLGEYCFNIIIIMITQVSFLKLEWQRVYTVELVKWSNKQSRQINKN